jgi:hypothetical protein
MAAQPEVLIPTLMMGHAAAALHTEGSVCHHCMLVAQAALTVNME